MPATATDRLAYSAAASDLAAYRALGAVTLATSPIVKAVTLSKNPVGYWRLNEPSGATAWADSSGHGNPMAQVGTGVGVSASAAMLPGDPAVGSLTIADQGNSLQAPYSAILHPGNVFGLSWWMAIPNGAVMRRVFDLGSDVTLFGSGSTTQLVLGIGAGGSPVIWSANGVGLWNDGTPHHWAITKNGAVNHLWRDGVDVTPAVTDQTIVTFLTAIAIGVYTGGSASGMTVQEFALFSYALSPADVSDLYLAGKTALGAVATASDVSV